MVVGGIVYFQFWKDAFLKNMFATMKPPPATVTVVEVKSEVVPNLLTAVGGLAAVHQVNVTSDVSGRITDIMFQPGAHVEAGAALVQLFDGPEQGDLASFKAQAQGAQAALERAKQLASRQFGPQSTVDATQATYDQARPASPGRRPSFRKSWCARRSRANSACAWSRSDSTSPPARRSCR